MDRELELVTFSFLSGISTMASIWNFYECGIVPNTVITVVLTAFYALHLYLLMTKDF